ncbi:MAG: hypothetical protein AB8H47_30460, partial [Bacteroidia bacterium]
LSGAEFGGEVSFLGGMLRLSKQTQALKNESHALDSLYIRTFGKLALRRYVRANRLEFTR